MARKIDLKKTVYEKVVYPSIINTKFSELGTVSVNEQIEETTTVSQFLIYIMSYFMKFLLLGMLIHINI